MSQQLQGWRSASSQRLWLSMLIDTAEEISRPERRAMPCDGQVLAALRAQLARRRRHAFRTARLTACETELPGLEPAYSPANCSRGCCPSSTPRSLASSRAM